MTNYIAILRGINVGGRRKILMANLRKLFQGSGFDDIQTYIQSGNVLFTAVEEDAYKLSLSIEDQIRSKYGFEVPVIIRTVNEIEQAVSNNPFLKKDIEIERLYLTFLKETPTAEKLTAIKSFDYTPDTFEIIGKDVFGFCAGKYSETKYSNQFFEKQLSVQATTRNWKTVLKLLEMAGSK